ncbi:MAG: hypothetical protein QGF53_06980 [Alphaproteobacteria bacterium]|nr:hypothetical protein [Alphaproteobacteria bacterium]
MARSKLLHGSRQPRANKAAIRAEVGYRRRLVFLRLVVPTAALALIASLVAYPLLKETKGRFRLDFADSGFTITGRDEMLNPRFVGTDSANQPYTVTAETAMRPSGDDDVIFLVAPQGDITLEDGDWLLVSADQGLFDRRAETLELTGSVKLFTDSGFAVDTDQVMFDLAQGSAVSDRPVHGQGPWGLLDSVGFEYRPEGRVFHFAGRPRLILYTTDEG